MLKKIFAIVVMMILIIGMCENVKAAELKTSLNVVKIESEAKQLENNQGIVKNKIVSYDSGTGTIKMQLSVSNAKPTYENTEILIIVDENLANNSAKLNQYISQVSSLANIVFKLNIKIGIIGMKGTISDQQAKSGVEPNDQGKVNGSASDAEVLVNATNDAQAITTALQNMNKEKATYNSNLQAAIKLAKSSYSNNVNKMLINTYNGMPSTAIGVCKEVTYGKDSQYETQEQAQKAKDNEIISKTKTELLSLKNTDIHFILLKLENSNSAQTQNLYGTASNPTYGKIYSLDSGSLTTTLLKMYQEFAKVKNTDMTAIIAKVYFPKEIIDNYHITIAENTENVDATKYETESYITWNIDALKTGETATLEYTLQMDNIGNTSLLNKTIATNEKVEITYQDGKEEEYTATLSSSPAVQLINEQEQEQEQQNNTDNVKKSSSEKDNHDTIQKQQEDTTTAKGEIPQTGVNTIILMSILSVTMLVIIIAYKKYNQYKDI